MQFSVFNRTNSLAVSIGTRRSARLASQGLRWSRSVKVKAEAAPSNRQLRVRYVRRDGNYNGWGLHTWGDVATHTDWALPLTPTGFEDGSPFWDVLVTKPNSSVGLLVHRGEDKSAGGEMLQVAGDLKEVWLVADHWSPQTAPPDMSELAPGSLAKSYAHWVLRDELVWQVPLKDSDGCPRSFTLHYSGPAHLHITSGGVQNSELAIPLVPVQEAISPPVVKKFPHLYGFSTFKIPGEYLEQVPQLLKGQLAISCSSSSGTPLDATSLQLQGALDDLFTFEGPLGDHWAPETGAHALSVWAPTASKVEVLHWKQARGGDPEVHPMTEQRGVWSMQRPADWIGTFYKYRVTVYCPLSMRVEVSEAVDPYARATTANGERTIIVDLDSVELMPVGWREAHAPTLPSWLHQNIYELHIRDFSASDITVPAHLRGKYRAFCPQYAGTTAGLQHLDSLQKSGLNTIHLLPSYDFGSVPEREEEQAVVQEDLSTYPPDSDKQQQLLMKIADQDAYNWGYDPVNYGVPEGSYSTDPDSPRRVLEYREMVQALHRQGYRVVLDVVYNHTFRSGPQDQHSVLDKVVPGYYHRRELDGSVCNSTCCNNTASEHAMCERLVVDDILHWAKTYKVDGFRFDIMGHLMVTTMNKIRSQLSALTLESDGVDGASMYIYGEAWDFGEVAFNQRGRNASQINLAGSGLGSFNERMRDPAIGGNPFSSVTKQGFITGLATDPNAAEGDSLERQTQELLTLTDHMRFALAGNMREYELELSDGKVEKGGQVPLYAGQPVAYGKFPWENIPFVGCHDNETIFDRVTMKAPVSTGIVERVRMCQMAMALVALAQGVPFFHAGDELLRSKSLDRDSYNSGDWFNRIDWTGQDNNFGVGLPPASKNQPTWPFKAPLLANAALKPPPHLIAQSAQYFRTVLELRSSSPLFFLQEPGQIQSQLRFHNTGPGQIPGVVVMELLSAEHVEGGGSGVQDPLYHRVTVVFNASPLRHTLPLPEGSSGLSLHPLLQQSQDDRVRDCRVEGGMMTVSPRTTAVFVLPK